MSQTYIKRSLEPVLKKAAAEFPAVVLTGPKIQNQIGVGPRYVLDNIRNESKKEPFF